MNNRSILLALSLLVQAATCRAQATQPAATAPDAPAAAASAAQGAASQPERPKVLDLALVVINGSATSGATVGLDYKLSWNSRPFVLFEGPSTKGNDTFTLSDVSATRGDAFLRLHGKGTIAAKKSLNPHKMIDLGTDAGAEISALSGYYRLGGSLKLESDQSLDERQYFYGLTAQATWAQLLVNSGVGSIILGYGRVDPGKNELRKALLGDLRPFRRWDAEVTYSMRLTNPWEKPGTASWLKLRDLSLSYRHYQEIGAAAAIDNASLDRNRLGAVRIGLDNGLFVQYARGSLPFDKRSDRAVMIGWSTNLDGNVK